MEQTQAINTEANFWLRMTPEDRVELTEIIIQMEEAGLDPEAELLKALEQKGGNKGCQQH